MVKRAMPRPRKGEERGRLLKRVGFSIYENDVFNVDVVEAKKTRKVKVTGQQLVDILLQLKTVDPYRSEGDIVKALTTEAAYHHNPGNPGASLHHWFPDSPLPFSQAAREKGFGEPLEAQSWGEQCPNCGGSGKTRHGTKCLMCYGFGRIGKGEHY